MGSPTASQLIDRFAATDLRACSTDRLWGCADLYSAGCTDRSHTRTSIGALASPIGSVPLPPDRSPFTLCHNVRARAHAFCRVCNRILNGTVAYAMVLPVRLQQLQHFKVTASIFNRSHNACCRLLLLDTPVFYFISVADAAKCVRTRAYVMA